MRQTFRHSIGAAVALLALVQAPVAYAQNCVEQDDVADASIYAMPLLVSAFSDKCSSELSADGFIATEGDALTSRYTALQNRAWPGAFRLLGQFASKGKGDDEMTRMLQSLPQESVRPFVDAIIQQKVGEEIKLGDCAKIERGVEMLAPLPPENIGGLIAFLLDVTKVDNPSLCPYEPE